jgi:hypothetical protein
MATFGRRFAASRRSATKSADARRGAADGGELRQAAGAAAPVAADKRGVTRLQPLVREAFVRRFDDATRRRLRYRPGTAVLEEGQYVASLELAMEDNIALRIDTVNFQGREEQGS